MKLLAEVSGVVPVPVAEVFIRIAGTLRAQPYNPGFEMDAERRFLAQQGGWWYRGEYTVEADPAGARVTHRVYNVATWSRWAVPLANRFFIGFPERVTEGFDRMLGDLTRPGGEGRTLG
ncbi:hypothetical protein P3102_09935 [Amycolatopsis sp. QT-25]|uniref:hypothetical protein n=1 Tax=Amycolatopsis sp. QT-25 TaxID=3034022 RepID=UPI0023EA7B90|nr:hypothetical protein [Amycolatopsis sp. QT-25]WET81502.1 hypothetical protein P3102_09935 [Amycolatopsis sp. QT-25]